MQLIHYSQLPHGGFAGLEERRFVTDSRVFGRNPLSGAVDGIGQFVYLADANFFAHGQTGMHGHKEIDVISVMTKGSVAHQGSLEHGQSLHQGQAQVQRAGGEGFSHNEVNPDDEQNQMIQLWVMPDAPGERAGYQVFEPKNGELTKIYGGSKNQTETMHNSTSVYVANGSAGQTFSIEGPVMAYVSAGSGNMSSGKTDGEQIKPRTLARSETGLSFTADNDCQIIFIQ